MKLGVIKTHLFQQKIKKIKSKSHILDILQKSGILLFFSLQKDLCRYVLMLWLSSVVASGNLFNLYFREFYQFY